MSDQSKSTVSALDTESVKKYVTGETELTSLKFKCKYVSPDESLVSFASDAVGMTSDCFILYAAAWLGMAAKESIIAFLEKKRQLGNGLAISDRDSMERFLSGRIHVLLDRGLLYSVRYITRENYIVQLYGITDSGFEIMRQRLRKVGFSNNHAFAYKPARDIIEWSGAAYVGSRLLSGTRVICELERTFFSRGTGSVFFPFEFRSKGDDGNLFYVAGMNGNWVKDGQTQTEREYEKWVDEQLNVIQSYLTRRTNTGTAVVCMVVESVENLKILTAAIAQSDVLRGLLDRIVFTGEGLVRRIPVSEPERLRNVFLKMEVDGNQVHIVPLAGGATFV